MSRKSWIAASTGSALLLGSALLVYARNAEPKERTIKESDVPATALAAMKKVAGGEKFTHFEVTDEHGHKLYEGTFSGKEGSVDVEVTETGEVMEIEAAVANEHVPASVLAAAEKLAGKGTKVRAEKVTMTLYEFHFKKDGHKREAVFTPAGDPYHEPGSADEKDMDEDD